VHGSHFRPEAVKDIYRWIRKRVQEHTPTNEFARQVVVARGSSIENGATNFYALHQDAESMTENISQAFLGLSIGCAKCHNHPLEKWTNDQYYAMANLFARVRTKPASNGHQVIFSVNEGDVIQPLGGKPRAPQPLDGKAIAIDAPGDRREVLADWLVSREN